MLRLLKWAVVLAAIAAVLAFVPIHGRTTVDRWRKAKDASSFAVNLWHEVKQAWGPEEKAPPHRSAAAQHPATRARTQARNPARPSEQHTEADRAAIDRILTEHAN